KEYFSCFISYNHNDEEFATQLRWRLQTHGLRVWYAPTDLQPGQKIHEQLQAGIDELDKLLLVLSEHSMTSEWVQTEIYHARRREVATKKPVLFPVRLCSYEAIRSWSCFDADTGRDMARELREYFIPDFSNWRHDDIAFAHAVER